ncbi:hypothetical protein ABUE31_17125 [Mesorhizobium sp. ZMM04-5]|uniref:DUF2946 domain-containing protein n=1 Tax=Mesorhizobium marinum TaxID=3228790 RepID=A0ABV3R3U7_9HYPH
MAMTKRFSARPTYLRRTGIRPAATRWLALILFVGVAAVWMPFFHAAWAAPMQSGGTAMHASDMATSHAAHYQDPGGRDGAQTAAKACLTDMCPLHNCVVAAPAAIAGSGQRDCFAPAPADTRVGTAPPAEGPPPKSTT